MSSHASITPTRRGLGEERDKISYIKKIKIKNNRAKDCGKKLEHEVLLITPALPASKASARTVRRALRRIILVDVMSSLVVPARILMGALCENNCEYGSACLARDTV